MGRKESEPEPLDVASQATVAAAPIAKPFEGTLPASSVLDRTLAAGSGIAGGTTVAESVAGTDTMVATATATVDDDVSRWELGRANLPIKA